MIIPEILHNLLDSQCLKEVGAADGVAGQVVGVVRSMVCKDLEIPIEKFDTFMTTHAKNPIALYVFLNLLQDSMATVSDALLGRDSIVSAFPEEQKQLDELVPKVNELLSDDLHYDGIYFFTIGGKVSYLAYYKRVLEDVRVYHF